MFPLKHLPYTRLHSKIGSNCLNINITNDGVVCRRFLPAVGMTLQFIVRSVGGRSGEAAPSANTFIR